MPRSRPSETAEREAAASRSAAAWRALVTSVPVAEATPALAARALPVDRDIVMIPLLGALAPSAANVSHMAVLYDQDAQYASSINVLTTLSCIVTIPLWIMAYEAMAGL